MLINYLYHMSKVKSAFFCQNCGYESVKWVGQCPSCGQWNVFVEELIQKETSKNWNYRHKNAVKYGNYCCNFGKKSY